MRLTLEKRTTDSVTKSSNCSDIKNIKEELGRQNRIKSKYIYLLAEPNQNSDRFFKSFIGPGDEVLTVGPTDENICRAITSCNASYFEFYEKPPFLPDSLGCVGKITTHTKLIFLGNPNRYTGVVYSEKEIEDILNISSDIIVVLDESTFESSRITAIDLIKKYDNLALVRLFENGKNSYIKYIIGSPIIIEKVAEGRLDSSYCNTNLSAILNNLKNQGNRLGRIKDARQEMLYLSIRLRMFGVGCFLNPDYSLVINSADPEEILFLLNETGVRGLDMARYPGLDGNILLQFSLDINAMSIINMFENRMKDKKYNRLEGNRLTIYRPSESNSKLKVGRNREIVSGDRLENNIVF